MAGSSTNSFIPKRRNSKLKRSGSVRKVFFVSIITYSLLIASLLVAGGAFLYKNITNTQLEREVVQLDSAVNTFSVQDFQTVQEFDDTLTKTRDRLDNTISVVAVLDELDSVVAQPIQIIDLNLVRNDDVDVTLTISFTTETLDAALFQRKILNANSTLFDNISITEVDVNSGNSVVNEQGEIIPPSVAFQAEFTIPIGRIKYDPFEARLSDVAEDINVTPEGFSVEETEALLVENNEIEIADELSGSLSSVDEIDVLENESFNIDTP